MGKAAAAGILVALLAGLAIGYFVLPMIFPIQASDTRQTFFIDGADACQVNSSKQQIPGLRLDFNTQAGDGFIVTFTCRLEFQASTATQTHQIVLFEMLYDELYTPSYYYQDTTDNTNGYFLDIYFNIYYEAVYVDPGPHNITMSVQYSGSILIMNVKSPLLTVQIV